jgi:hypothetical protein
VFTLIILNFTEANDYAIANDIYQYQDYRVIDHLPPGVIDSHNGYTVWQVTGGQ